MDSNLYLCMLGHIHYTPDDAIACDQGCEWAADTVAETTPWDGPGENGWFICRHCEIWCCPQIQMGYDICTFCSPTVGSSEITVDDPEPAFPGAVHLNGREYPLEAFVSHMRSCRARPVTESAMAVDANFTLSTPYGLATGRAGDYLFLDEYGEASVVSREEFESHYEFLTVASPIRVTRDGLALDPEWFFDRFEAFGR